MLPESFSSLPFAVVVETILEALPKLGAEMLSLREADMVGENAKPDDSPVTRADMLSHRTIVDLLRAKDPTTPILSEESKNQIDPADHHTYWLLDPLDGTKEYIAGSDEFAIALARIDNGQPIFGLIYAPAKEELFIALNTASEKQAFKSMDSGWTPLFASSTKTLQGIVVSRSHLDEGTKALVAQHPKASVTQMGSCLKFCYVADGTFDFYPKANGLYIWDVAAGHAILEAAGGHITDHTKQPLRYDIDLKVAGIYAHTPIK